MHGFRRWRKTAFAVIWCSGRRTPASWRKTRRGGENPELRAGNLEM